MSETPDPITGVAVTSAPNSTWPVIAAVITVVVATMGAVVAVTYWGDDQTTPIVVAVFGFAAPTVVALLALIKMQHVGDQTSQLRIEINHRLTELVSATSAAANAEGREAGGATARQEAVDAVLALATARNLLARQEVELEALRTQAGITKEGGTP